MVSVVDPEDPEPLEQREQGEVKVYQVHPV